ncbi:MAG TPA: DinB family protein [Fluviicola sp.]|nr:DinB family protein [Fluviicola sp.]
MEITSIETFLPYLERNRDITKRLIEVIPHDKLDWSYLPGKFTLADLIRHIAGIERHVFAQTAAGKPINYTGCGKDLADGFENIMAYFNRLHEETLEILRSLNDEDLKKTIRAVDGREIQLGQFLRALIIHEVHHRGAMYIYLNLLGVKTPPVLGLTEEQVRAFSEATIK